MLGKILCSLGLHRLEKEPSQKEIVKGTGVHFFFFSEGIQKGIKKCTRKECQVQVKVYREGLVGTDCPNPTWQRLDPEKEAFIDSLPGVFQA